MSTPAMNQKHYASDLMRAAELALDQAKKLGMDQAEVSLHNGTGISLNARQQQLETVEKHNDSQLQISVYKDHKTGSASSADLSDKGVQDTVAAAASIANYTGADSCFGLADKDRMAGQEIELGLYYPWQNDISGLSDLALQCEQAALQYDARISNSEGAAVNTYSGHAVYANSHGFLSATQASQHSVSCSVIAGTDSGMQRDYWYDSNRDPNQLMPVSEIGEQAARRTVRRLNARKIKSTTAPVLFDSTIAASLIGHLIGAISGGVIYKKASFLLDQIDQLVLPKFVTISEHPHKQGAARSAWHDNEGVATSAVSPIITDGVLQRYVLASFTARKLKLDSTANSGGVRNLNVSHTGQNFDELMGDMRTGLWVTELIGSGINMLTGDYSRGAAGFWVENGEVKYPVEEITIAGNLIDMFKNILAIGTDVDQRGNIDCGSILLENMTIAGS